MLKLKIKYLVEYFITIIDRLEEIFNEYYLSAL